VLLVDKKQELGAPIQCSGAVSARALADAGVQPAAEFTLAPIFGFATYRADGEMTTLDYRQLKPEPYEHTPLGYVVDRRRFDRYLMTLAERAGTEVWLKTEGTGYTVGMDGVVEVRLERVGQPAIVRARVMVGADGVQSQVGRWAGLRTHLTLDQITSCLQYVVDGVETHGLLEIITGKQWAPGGYAWIFPKGHGYAEIGLGVTRTMTRHDARYHLDHFLQQSFLADRFRNVRILEVQGGGVPLAPPLKTPYADGLLLVGDAARHVNPITGGGIHTALRDGVLAGNFLGDFLPAGQPALAQHLAEFQQRWLAEMGELMRELYRIKLNIFRKKNADRQDEMLYETLAGYFHPSSKYRRM
jgi:digeranylgeranylglycerophospholipid reductase